MAYDILLNVDIDFQAITTNERITSTIHRHYQNILSYVYQNMLLIFQQRFQLPFMNT